MFVGGILIYGKVILVKGVKEAAESLIGEDYGVKVLILRFVKESPIEVRETQRIGFAFRIFIGKGIKKERYQTFFIEVRPVLFGSFLV